MKVTTNKYFTLTSNKYDIDLPEISIFSEADDNTRDDAIVLTVDLIKEKKRVDISAKIQYFLSEQSFTHLMKLWVNYFNNTNYAETLNNINTDINQMTSIADSSVFFVITQAFSMTGGIIGLFIIDFRMTVLVLLFIPIKCVVMKYFAKKQKARKRGRFSPGIDR